MFIFLDEVLNVGIGLELVRVRIGVLGLSEMVDATAPNLKVLLHEKLDR